MNAPRIVVAVLAHNEERRIAACLSSLPLDDPDVAVHVLVNGTRDRTAELARQAAGGRATVHDWAEGGKARTWNRFVLDTPGLAAETFVFVDGDAQVAPGSIRALADTLARDRVANAASGMPRNGRRVETYRQGMQDEHGLFGDLYALRGSFVARLRDSGIRLPEDLIGDDGLIGALAKTDLAGEDAWLEERVVVCPEAGFLCEPASLLSPHTLRLQYRRMVNYSQRHFQNRIISATMSREGPRGLPSRLRELYPQWLPQLKPRANPVLWWFDRAALARMRRA